MVTEAQSPLKGFRPAFYCLRLVEPVECGELTTDKVG